MHRDRKGDISWKGRVSEEGKEGQIWSRYFLLMYEYGTLKTVKVILRRGVGPGAGGSHL
jgi:hypothetical protein